MKYGIRRRPSTLMESFFADDVMDSFTYGTELDIYKEDDQFLVELEIPGFDRDDIHVEFKGDILSIKGQHKEESEEEEKDYFYQSRSFDNVHRQIRFTGVDEDNVQATYKNGVLKVVLPTKVKSDVVNKIDIK